MLLSFTKILLPRRSLKKKILESEQKLRNVIEQSAEGIVLVDEEGIILEWNASEERITGLPREKVIGKYLWDIQTEISTNPYNDVFKTRMKELTLELLTKGKSSWMGEETEIEIIRPDGTQVNVASLFFPIKSNHGFMACSINRDISELKNAHKELKKSEIFLSNVLDNIPSLISVKEAENLTYIKINRPMEKYLNLTDKEVFGKNVHDIFEPNEADFYTQQDQLVIHDRKIIEVTEGSFTTNDHQVRVIDEKKIPMFDENGRLSNILSIVNDITDRKTLEAEKDAHLTKLEAVSRLSTGLQSITTLKELYPTLLDILLHVLRAPMGCIWLYNSESDLLNPVYSSGGGNDNDILTDGPLKPGKGIPGMVFQSHKTYVSANYDSDPYMSEHKRGLLHTKLGGVTFPLLTTNSVVGVVNISFNADREVTDSELKLLTTLSEIAGNAIQNISLQEQTEQRLTRILAISSIDRAITSTLDLQVSLDILVSHVVTELKVDAADIMLFNPHSQLLEFSTGQGFLTNMAESTYLRLGESYAGLAALTREIIQIPDLSTANNPLFKELQYTEKIFSYFAMPLVARGQLKGVLEVFNRSTFIPDEDWINYFQSLAEQASIAIDNTQMFDNLQRSNTELSLAYNATIEGWSRALDLRDKETEGHTLRVTELTERLAGFFKFPDAQIKYIRWGALLHDIGKLGVPDGILLKPGPLTDQEWIIMRMHPQYAFDMLSPIGYLKEAIDIPYCHHEKWDGTGYPRGISGEKIPLAARIFSVVDIWDALRSDRPYRPAWSVEKVKEHILSLSGTHLDPDVVRICRESRVFQNDLD